MNEMTLLESAKRIEVHNSIHSKNERFAPLTTQALNIAAAHIRKIASGEYKQVVHARWEETDTGWYHCSSCGDSCGALGDETPFKSEHCPPCGAVMDGKDGTQ